MIINQETITNS